MTRPGFERVLLDSADEYIQDLVAAFSAARPSFALLSAVCALYFLSGIHLLFAIILPFYRTAVEHVTSVSTTDISQPQLAAFATGIIIGGISFHVLLAVVYALLSFIVRAPRKWTSIAATMVLVTNIAVAVNGLRTPHIATTLTVLQWITCAGASTSLVCLWCANLLRGAQKSRREDIVATLDAIPSKR